MTDSDKQLFLSQFAAARHLLKESPDWLKASRRMVSAQLPRSVKSRPAESPDKPADAAIAGKKA